MIRTCGAQQLDELFDSGRELGQVLEEVARLGVRLLFQVALEAEVTEFLGAIAMPAGSGRTRATATATPRSR